MPSDKEGYVDTHQDNEVTDGSFVTEQRRWEDSKLDHAVMKFGAKDAKKVFCNTKDFKLQKLAMCLKSCRASFWYRLYD